MNKRLRVFLCGLITGSLAVTDELIKEKIEDGTINNGVIDKGLIVAEGYDYEIVENIINEVHIKGPTVKKAYDGQPSKENLPSVSLLMFCKTGNGYDSVYKRTVTDNARYINPQPDNLSEYLVRDYIFTDKKLAIAVVRALKKADQQKLVKFNEQHGTNHEYPFCKL